MLVSQTRLLWGHDNDDIGRSGFALTSKRLILATVEFVNEYVPEVYQQWHSVQVRCVCIIFQNVSLGVHLRINCVSNTSMWV